jgi:hypothetical protein
VEGDGHVYSIVGGKIVKENVENEKRNYNSEYGGSAVESKTNESMSPSFSYRDKSTGKSI